MIPDRRGPVLVRVLERGEARPPLDAVRRGRLACEELVPRAFRCVARRDVLRGRQIPRLRVAVAVVGHTHGAMHVRDDRHRARVGARGRRERRPAVTVIGAAGRVRPVQRRIDRQQMRQERPVRVHQLVDPLDPHRPVPHRLDRERGGVVDQQPTVALRRFRAVPPHGRCRQPRGQDLLRELPHRDLVVVDVLAPALDDRVGTGHHRRDQHRCLELRDHGRIERAARNLSQRNGRAHARNPPEEIEAGTRTSDPGDERPPREPPHCLHDSASPECSLRAAYRPPRMEGDVAIMPRTGRASHARIIRRGARRAHQGFDSPRVWVFREPCLAREARNDRDPAVGNRLGIRLRAVSP